MKDVNKLFRWGNAITERALKRLVERRQISAGVTREDTLTGTRKKGEWLALGELCA